MLKRRPDLPKHMEGGMENPLGARAIYLVSSEYRIHGSNEPDTIGTAVSSGCIRMTNRDVIDHRVKVGTKVVVSMILRWARRARGWEAELINESNV
jgi:lipoprotein-anchoring transpeptidase ErfK/SrfK